MEAILGVDVGMEELLVELVLPDGKRLKKPFRNVLVGFKEANAWVQKQGVTTLMVCMEATGRYGEAFAEFMHFQGYTVYVVNPKRIRRYAEAIGLLDKNDKADAHAIAEFASNHHKILQCWNPKPAAQKNLRDIRCHIVGLQKARQAMSNRLVAGMECPQVIKSLEKVIDMLESEIAAAKEQAEALIEEDEQLRKNKEILISMLGIGPVISTALLVYIDFAAFRHGRQVARFVGTTPKREQSGISINRNGHISKEGSSDLRALLWNGARAAIRNDPGMRAFAQRLHSRGKDAELIRCAVVRKMLVRAHALIRKQTAFDIDYKHSLAKAS